MNLPRAILIFIFSVLVTISHSQDEDWLSFTNGHEVIDVVKDSAILWIATSGGIVWIDEINQDTVFYTKSNTGLETYLINCVEVDKDHNLWVGTDGKGVFLFDGAGWIKNPYGLSLPTQYVTDIKRDSLGDIWIGCHSYLDETYFPPIMHRGGLLMFDGTDWINHSDKLSANNHLDDVFKIEIDHEGKVIIADEAVIIFDWDSWEYQYPNGNQDVEVYDFAIDGSDQIWVLQDTLVLCMYDGLEWYNYPLEQSLTSLFYCITASLSNIYLGADVNNDFGLMIFDGTSWSNITSSDSDLTTNRIKSLNTISDNIYIGTNGEGLCILNGNQEFTNINTSNSTLMDNWIESAYVDPYGVLYTSTYNYIIGQAELYYGEGSQWGVFGTIPTGPARTIIHDAEGRLWVGGWKGVAVYADTSWTLYDSSNTSFPHCAVNSMAVDGDGNLWIAGGDSYACFIAKYDGNSWITYLPPLVPHSFYKIVIDTDNNKWIGAYDGLFLFDKNDQWTEYANFAGPFVTDNHVFDLEIANTTLWMATGSGLYRKDSALFTPITDMVSRSLGVDVNDNVWVSAGGSLHIYSATNQLIHTFTSQNSGLPYRPPIQEVTITSEGIVYMASGNSGIIQYKKGNEIGIEEIPAIADIDLNLYPNPSNGIITINSSKLSQISEGKIYSIDGKLIYRFSIKHFTQQATINLSFLDAGTYVLSINNTYSKLIIISRN